MLSTIRNVVLIPDTSTNLIFKTDNTSAGSSNNNQVKLPLQSNGTYNFIVDWGDRTNSKITVYNQAEVTHTYSSIGTYNIKITGVCNGFRFNNSGDKLKLLNIKKWGKYFKLGNNGDYFFGCTNLVITAEDILNTSEMTDFSQFFLSCTSLIKVPNIGRWITSNITDMSSMFYNATYFNDSIGNWDTRSLTTAKDMFHASITFNQPIGNWNMSNVTTMENMFMGAEDFNQDISNWDVSNCESFASTFRSCDIFNQNISSWNMSSATTLYFMFYLAYSFNQPIGVWDTSNVTDMNSTLKGATSFNQDLSNWNVESITTASGFLQSVTISTTNYDALLNGWASQNVPNSISFHAGSSKYSSNGLASRTHLTGTHLWTITDGGSI